jgi:protein-S-isoprenylcysteine O-methyltransferase Ste14
MHFPHHFTNQIILACWVIFVITWLAMSGRVKRTVERGSSWAGIGSGAGVAADVLILLGLYLAIWARVTIGRNWSATVTFKENHELIVRGPYRFVRHPI